MESKDYIIFINALKSFTKKNYVGSRLMGHLDLICEIENNFDEFIGICEDESVKFSNEVLWLDFVFACKSYGPIYRVMNQIRDNTLNRDALLNLMNRHRVSDGREEIPTGIFLSFYDKYLNYKADYYIKNIYTKRKVLEDQKKEINEELKMLASDTASFLGGK